MDIISRSYFKIFFFIGLGLFVANVRKNAMLKFTSYPDWKDILITFEQKGPYNYTVSILYL